MLKFNSIDAVILGCVQGVTEFLPVSSTGHLILANHFLKLNGHEEQVTDPKAYAETKKALDDYLAIIQLGTVIILFIFYWSKIVLLLKGLFNRSQEGLLLLRNLIIAFLPAAASGFLLDGLIQRYIYRNWSVLLALFAGGLLMLWVERRRKRGTIHENPTLEPHELSIKQALFIGCMQAVALWPGTSRSMMTLLGGYLVGLKPVKSVAFSFLLGLVTMSTAISYKLLRNGSQMVQVLDMSNIIVGCLFAAISGGFAIRWLINFLPNHSLRPFAYYRILLAIVLLWLL